MKKAFLFFLIALCISSVFAQTPQTTPTATAQPVSADLTQYGMKIEPDQRLIVMMAALEAAGVETPLAQTGDEFRLKLREDLKDLNPDLRQKLKSFVTLYKGRHQKATPGEIVAPFVSLAYMLSPVPELANPATNAADLPSDVLEVLDFATLVREFYKTSGISQKLPEYVAIYKTEGEKMRISSARMAREVLSYLHTRPEIFYNEKTTTEAKDEKNKNKTTQKVSLRERERRFYVVPDLLAPAGAVIFQNIRDDYYVIVPASTNLDASDVRRGYLQYVFDPMVLKNAQEILPKRDSIRILLDERRKTRPEISPDVFLAVSRSLVAAADARQIEYRRVQAATIMARQKIDKTEGVEAKKAVSAELAALKQAYADETALQLSDAYDRGAVLAFYFADQLKGLEDSGFDVASSLRSMVIALDATKESNRLTQYADARRRALSNREAGRSKKLELPKKLLDINELINKKNYEEANAQLKMLLDENPGESRIYYNLGRISSLTAQDAFDEGLRDKRLDDAKAFYTNAINSATAQTDPALLQLSYVALGRIYEFYDEKETALAKYEAAIKIGEVEGGAYKEALAAKDNLIKKP